MAITDRTPATVRGYIETSGANFDPAAARAEYAGLATLWQLYLDLYEADATKLAALVERHHEDEPDAKYEKRQALACCYNLIPTIIDMIGGYIFSEQPKYDVGEDEDLLAFVADADGGGRSLERFIKETALPSAMVFGHLDVLVENPAVVFDRPAASVADVAGAKLRPHVVPVTPLQRLNWSAQRTGTYNWLRFRDTGHENPNPFASDPSPPESYLTYSMGADGAPAFWVRSWRDAPAQQRPGEPAPEKKEGGDWTHEGDETPTARVPVASLHHRRSIDPDKRATGLSKIAQVAVLTKGIIQILSWTHEDVLSNLAIWAIPSKRGEVPKDPESGAERVTEMTSFTIMWYDGESGATPLVVQGDVSHIEIKLKLVEMHLREILRLMNLLAASGSQGGEGGSGGKSTSGRQSEIERSELYRELGDTAAKLDAFALELLALAKSWATGTDWTAERLKTEAGVKVEHCTDYSIEPLADMIANTQAAVALFAQVSPTAVQAGYEQLARAFMRGDGDALKDALKEIETNTGDVVESQVTMEQRTNEAAVATAEAAAEQAAEVGPVPAAGAAKPKAKKKPKAAV